jgi:hypothetical protein
LIEPKDPRRGVSELLRPTFARAAPTVINLAEVRLFNSSGNQIPVGKLRAQLSSTYKRQDNDGSASNCIDDIIPKEGDKWNFCHTPDDGSDLAPWLRVTYPCAEGLSKVIVYNRVDTDPGKRFPPVQDRLLRFQMRFLDETNSTVGVPYQFTTVQANYTIEPGDCYCYLLVDSACLATRSLERTGLQMLPILQALVHECAGGKYSAAGDTHVDAV